MKKVRSSQRISKIGTTSDTITGRGGIALFSRYLEMTGILDILESKFGFIRKSAKGLPVWILFKQIFCFLLDGTSRHLTYFDQLQKDVMPQPLRQNAHRWPHRIRSSFFLSFSVGGLHHTSAGFCASCLFGV